MSGVLVYEEKRSVTGAAVARVVGDLSGCGAVELAKAVDGA